MARAALSFALALVVITGAAGGARPLALRQTDFGVDHLEPRWSPDGTRIVFREAYDPPKSGGRHDLAVLVPDGSARDALFDKPTGPVEEHDRDAQWSPDGSRIAFTRELGLSTSDVMVVNSDGTGMRTLTPQGEAEEADAVWSPDGSTLAFTRRGRAAGTRLGIWVMQADGTDERQLTRNDDFDPTWSPDGHRIAFTRVARRHSVWLVPVAGGAPRRLTGSGRYRVHAWSGSREEILLARDGGYLETRASIWRIRGDGSGLTRLASGDEPSWSPDGRRLAFIRWSRRGGRPMSAIHLARADGSRARRIFAGSIGSWSPDSRRLALSASQGCNGAGIIVYELARDRTNRLTSDCRTRGSARSDHLDGSRERDFIWGGPGSDVIDANPGDRPNVFYGRLDDDVVRGGAGADRIWGRRGSDHLDGGPGADRVSGGRGADVVVGGPGDDRLRGGPFHDRLLPGVGRDIVFGGAGRDVIFAGDGLPDRIACGSGRDRVEADAIDRVANDCEFVRR